MSVCVLCDWDTDWNNDDPQYNVAVVEYSGPKFSVGQSGTEIFGICTNCQTADHELLRELYMRHGTGCCLHVVVDDHNAEDATVDFCIKWAQSRGHTFCEHLGNRLRGMSLQDRKKLLHVTR